MEFKVGDRVKIIDASGFHCIRNGETGRIIPAPELDGTDRVKVGLDNGIICTVRPSRFEKIGDSGMEFKVGDVFKVTDNHGYIIVHDGDCGRVKRVDSHRMLVKMSDGRELYMGENYVNVGIKKICIIQDTVSHPSYYNDGKIEVIDFIEDKGLNFNKGNAVKYIARAGKKDPTKEIEDLKKAQWYINREVKRLEGLEK